MRTYLVRRPVKDAAGALVGWELAYGNDPYEETAGPLALAEAVHALLSQYAAKALTGARNFLPCGPSLLIKKAPRLFRPDDLTILIGEDTLEHPLAMHLLGQYRKEGYRAILDGFRSIPRYFEVLDDVDGVRVDLRGASDADLHNAVEMASGMGKECFASGADDIGLARKGQEAGIGGMEGAYLSGRTAAPLFGADRLDGPPFRLLAAAAEPGPDLGRMGAILAEDPDMEAALLRLAGSAWFSYGGEREDVGGALAELGAGQLREWILPLCVAGSGGVPDASYEEALTLAAWRGLFTRELAGYCWPSPLGRAEAYLMGQLSVLPLLFDVPMEQICARIPLPDAPREGLLGSPGPCSALLDLVRAYEAADWGTVTMLAEQMRIPPERLAGIGLECLGTARAMWRDLSTTAS